MDRVNAIQEEDDKRNMVQTLIDYYFWKRLPGNVKSHMCFVSRNMTSS